MFKLFGSKQTASKAVAPPKNEETNANASPGDDGATDLDSASELETMDFEVNVDNVDIHIDVEQGVYASEWNGSGGCSHTDVVSSPDFIPPRFVYGCSKNAPERWAETKAWRVSHGIDNILSLPRPQFHLIKQHWQHFYCGRTPSDNRLVVYEHVGGLKQALHDLDAKHNISFQDVMTHYLYLTEYQWSILDTHEYNVDDTTSGQMIKVLDFQGIQLADVSNTNLRTFVTWTLRTIGQHYPERCGVVYLINTPKWFNAFWNVVQRLVSEVTRHKIRICPTAKEYAPKLRAWMGGSKFLPACIGGPVVVNGTTDLCADEAKLHSFVEDHTPM
ncbi:hypothetical protein, variant [Aphanomyces invadans]|nr:hypothetical protein, variant [Aphanomyces invadans]ETW06892.1 hypothetical protein, variant [Aphanomyces invadans]RHY26230.1 hypothetical protein DYB32_007792 [Aphanomyces invadans]|eukprot:XP_008864967.1 hypothetical protein, variant [Aphanomyces invadans]